MKLLKLNKTKKVEIINCIEKPVPKKVIKFDPAEALPMKYYQIVDLENGTYCLEYANSLGVIKIYLKRGDYLEIQDYMLELIPEEKFNKYYEVIRTE